MSTPTELELFLDIPVHCEAVVPGPVMRLGELLELSEGSVIRTGVQAGETVEVFAASARVGFAELAGANGHFAVRMVRFEAGSR